MLTLLASAALLVTAASPPTSATSTPATPASMPLEDFGGRLRAIRVKVNGHEGLFTLDTGGGVTLLSPEFAGKIGCTPWAAHTGFRLDGQRLDLPRCEDVRIGLPDGTQLAPVAAGVIDLQALLFKDAPKADGSLALDALEGRQFTLDLGNGTLVMETAESLAAETQGATEVPMRQARQAGGAALGILVPMPTAKGKLWMALDSGGGPPVLLRDRVAQAAGADAANAAMQPFRLQVGEAVPVTVETRALVRDMILDGVIGMPVLVRWKLSVDLAHDRLWIRTTR